MQAMRNRQIWALWLIGFLVFLGTSLSAASQYTEKVVIPQYNPNNPTHVLITPSNGKWNRYVLNNPNYKHFYLKPGKYLTKINLTASGTKSNRRTLSLLNGNNTHPAALPVSQIADARFYLAGASYWTIDRISVINTKLEYVTLMMKYKGKYATHNIINRLHAKEYTYGVLIEPFCHFNTIQNSYMDFMSHKGRLADNVAIALANSRIRGARTEGTKIINNDIRDANDGIQLIVSSGVDGATVSYPGTIIDSNVIWMDSDVYTNGDYAKNGYNKNGKYQIGENAIGLKSGSNDSKKPVIISNNVMFGYRYNDPTTGASSTPYQRGSAILSSGSPKNIKIHNNIMYDLNTPIQVMGGTNWDVRGNIFAKLNKVNPLDRKVYGALVYRGVNIRFEENTFVEHYTRRATDSGNFFSYNDYAPYTTRSTFARNVIINATGTSPKYSNTVKGNYYYNVKRVKFNGANEHFFPNASTASMKDYTFAYERFTKRPKHKTIKNAITTSKSPHYKKAGSVIHTRIFSGASYMQVDNQASMMFLIAL